MLPSAFFCLLSGIFSIVVYFCHKCTSQRNYTLAALPTRPIEKGIAAASLLAHIIIAKFVDHLPFYCQMKRFKRD
ncbi:MAG: hypothetical protein EPO28_07865 [Saprospiraceae bacterium]|nr:MAG: hypothetical protein EPO28_07865 [Saprospiraceae bacterium]